MRRTSITALALAAALPVAVAFQGACLGGSQHGGVQTSSSSRRPLESIKQRRGVVPAPGAPRLALRCGTDIEECQMAKPVYPAAASRLKFASKKLADRRFNASATADNIFTRSLSRSGWQREFNNEISRLGKSRQWRDALFMLEEMQARGVPPTTVTFNAAMSALNKGKQWARTLDMFEDVFGVGAAEGPRAASPSSLQPDSFSYAAALSACAQTRQLERAFTYFERMEAAGVKGNMYTYSALLAACENCEQPARAQEVFEQMQAQGIKPNANTIVHRHKTQRPRQYKKYVLRQHAARPLAAVRAPDLGSGDSAGPDSRTGGSFLPPPGADFRIPTGPFIVPDPWGMVPMDGRTAPPPSLMALQELSLSKPLFSLTSLVADLQSPRGDTGGAQGQDKDSEAELGRDESPS